MEPPQQIFLDLKIQVQELVKKLLQSQKENQKLQAENQKLQAENQKLHKRIAELEERLRTNSNNSSKPPSQDPHRDKQTKESSGKKKGAQPGHKPAFRNLVDKEKVSAFVDRMPTECVCGNTKFSTEDIVESKIHQQTELPPIEPIITQYSVHTCRCSQCGSTTKGQLTPEEKQFFGPRLKSFTTLLAVELQATKRKIQALLKHLNIHICVGMVTKIHQQAGDVLTASHNEIHEHVLKQPSVNGDETTWKIRGKIRYVWIATSAQAAYLSSPQSRCKQAFASVYCGFKNILNSDRYAAYGQHQGKRQVCHAHINRDFVAISERKGLDEELGQALLNLHEKMFHHWHCFKNGEISRQRLQEIIVNEIKTPLLTELLTGAVCDGYSKKTKGTCSHMLKDTKHFWTFAYEEGVEPTNNLAERDIRPLVVARKNSYGSQSDWGGEFTAKIFSVWLTIKKNGGKLWDFLQKTFICHARDDPPLSIFDFLYLNPS